MKLLDNTALKAIYAFIRTIGKCNPNRYSNHYDTIQSTVNVKFIMKKCFRIALVCLQKHFFKN